MFDDEPVGASPIDADEAEGLIPGHIHTRGELNAWEQQNIIEAARWVRTATEPALRESTILGLHKRMFDRTWEWAGRYRTSEKNIGVFWADIGVEVRKFVDDGAYWLEHDVSSVDEAAARLHHRLVLIHPFANGNGRHARLWCDLLLKQNGRPMFSWSSEELDRAGESRQRYIEALRKADGGDFGPLLGLLLRNRE
ncbi:MAG: mobile mystery protein B [Gemmatimonadetes bacterium]|nr:mobile mystery protein B [Gemmatimonadota bacterium]